MKTHPLFISAPMLLGLAISSHANPIVEVDVTSTLGPTFFFDTASIGGSDFGSADASFIRSFGIGNYTFNPTSTDVSITGIGFALSAAVTAATSATVTITYLGGDGVLGGVDDVLIGSATDTFTSTAAGEYSWEFTTPLTATVSGEATNFRIRVQTTGGTFTYKTTSGTTSTTAKLSVAGTYTSIVPADTEPDGIPDTYETNTGIYVSAFNTGTNPADSDTDDDGYLDGVETNTNTFISLSNPGTSPLKNDSDNDGLLDGVETNTGTFTNLSDTGTSPVGRDKDNDRLSDKYEVDNGLNPFANADFDLDTFSDAFEVLFYGSNPKSDLSYPGDGTSPAPGSFSPILDGTNALALGGTLVNAIINEAAFGGNDADYANGVTDFVIKYPNAFPAAGSAVSITGFAWPVISAINASGDILLQFFDPGADGMINGIDRDILVGTARGTLTVTGANTIMYWNFTPINFTSAGTGLMVKIQSTAAMRIKYQDNLSPADGQWYTNSGITRFGNIRESLFSIGGTAVAPPIPKILSITRSGAMTNLVWDLNGVPSVTLQRSTTLGGFTDVPGKINTTSISHQETSSDPKAFFRLATP